MSKTRGAKKRQDQTKGGKSSPSKRAKGPRSQTLPGMEQVRSRPLDNCCEAIVEERATMNKAKAEEVNLVQSALQTMQGLEISVYRHAGVELARIPGAEKLRVRLTKEQGDAGSEDLKQVESDEIGDAEGD